MGEDRYGLDADSLAHVAEAIARIVVQERLGHLTARRVMGAEKEDAGVWLSHCSDLLASGLKTVCAP